jgi:hypothetical protein
MDNEFEQLNEKLISLNRLLTDIVKRLGEMADLPHIPSMRRLEDSLFENHEWLLEVSRDTAR